MLTGISSIPKGGKTIIKPKNNPSIDNPNPDESDEQNDEFDIDEGILNSREPDKNANETFENPERILN